MLGRHAGSLLKETDLDKKQFLDLVHLAAELKLAKAEHNEVRRLVGKNIALVFEKNSTRTRCAFEVAAQDQGAHISYLGPQGSHIGKEESIRDTARVLARMYDGIEFRGYHQDTVEELANYAGVPVWNGLTDSWHPTQMLADVLTMHELSDGPIENIAVCFLGDGRSNVARSLLVTGALLGMDVRIAAPADLQPPADVLATAHELALTSGASVLVTADPLLGVRGARFVYTDVWVSMGEPEGEWARRIAQLRGYRVTTELMNATGVRSYFMHCLPALHDQRTEVGAALGEKFGLDGIEVTDEVFESDLSVVFDQAENRMHTIKAVLVWALAG